MSKKHFIALADVLKVLRTRYQQADSSALICTSGGVMLDAVESAMADFCAQQSSQFNRAVFVGYINGTNGPSGGAIKGKG